MKIIPLRQITTLLTGLAILLSAPALHATGQARAEFRNLSSSQAATQAANPGVASFNGYIKGSQSQSGGAEVLQECAFGQAFSQWFPSDTYAAPILATVKDALYPNVTPSSTRQTIADSAKPFRYKYLLYNGTGTDVTAFDPSNMETWFTQADRNEIYAQITVLKAAIAASPLDTGLRNLLLDIYFDLAVAEMQAAKPKLAELAKVHLGLTLPDTGKFIIDKEIDTYLAIDTAYQSAINQFQSLLATPFPDIDPSSFDPRIPAGTPLGQYLFRVEQANRQSTPSEYANENGTQKVPQSVGGNLETPDTLFSGYKDLKALLDLVGERHRHLAALSRLRGTRQAPGDLALARQSIAQATGPDGTDLQIIKSWFPELFPPNLAALTPAQTTAYQLKQQQSGVLASLAGIEDARLDLLSVIPFLNGSANMLGYDPDFLLLAQDSNTTTPRESYDVLRDLLKKAGNANTPLQVALDKLTNSKGSYTTFQENAEKTAEDIDAADTALKERFIDITGFGPDATPGFDFLNPNPTPGSELGITFATIEALRQQAETRKAITANFDELLAENADQAKAGLALQSITLAQAKEGAINGAVSTYRKEAGKLYDSSTAAKVASAVSQATTDMIDESAEALSSGNPFTAPVAEVMSMVAGAANIVIQGVTTGVIANNEKNIDFAGVDLSATTSKADIPLTVNQARLDLAALKRDQIANQLESGADLQALSQAVAQKSALLTELARIAKRRDTNVTYIRKKSYADPLHYYRAESALIDADESFAAAQRWMFITLQALNYKWHGQFAIVSGSKRYDTSTVFKARNAAELDDLLTQMVQWDSIRVTQTSSSPRIYSRISLRDHVLARNPQRFNLTDSSDSGLRVDDTIEPPPAMLPTVSTEQYFRNLLAARYKETTSGDIVIPFSTVFPNQPDDRVDGNFFRGATYNAAGTCIDQGFWREKIEYVKVNVIATDASSTPAIYSGVLTYGGSTYFHTRVPPRADRSVGGLAIDDAPGELLCTPFRFWVSPDFSLSGFQASPTQIVPFGFAYADASAFGSGTIPDKLSSNFQVNDFYGRSIAASGWELRLYRDQSNGARVNIDTIKDIEIIIAYKHSTRVFPPN